MEFINTYSKLGKEFFTPTKIETFESPFMIDYNLPLAKEMGLDISEEQALKYFSGNAELKAG
jgi:uncharacterized protein YdiU (UPF0061 family)